MSGTVVGGRVFQGQYQDSVLLMRVGETLRQRTGMADAGLMMGTPANHTVLADAGLDVAEFAQAGPDDLLVALRGTAAVVAKALDDVPALLASGMSGAAAYPTFASIADALAGDQAGSVGLISVPGEFAPEVALDFVAQGRHVMVFSDNVSLEEEMRLKSAAAEAGVIVMGPDAGTALLGGVAIGFANKVASGRIGIVAASGTGAQAISTAIARLGAGVSQIIGLGGRDLDDRVGGRSLWFALDALEGDRGTDVVVLVAKKAGPATFRRLVRRLAAYAKPVVLCLLTGRGGPIAQFVGAHHASSLRQAAEIAVSLLANPRSPAERPPLVAPNHGKLGPAFRGLFSGGTLAQEALDVARALLGAVSSNLDGAVSPSGHAVVDLGSDEYTLGRPHPMIDPRTQTQAVVDAANQAETGVVLFDVVLGYGAHEDPAAAHASAIAVTGERLAVAGRNVVFVAALVGAEADPQSWSRQAEQLRAAGCVVFDDGGHAAAFACLQVCVDDVVPPSDRSKVAALLQPRQIVSVGSAWFTDAVAAQGANVAHVNWRPPARLDRETEQLLELME